MHDSAAAEPHFTSVIEEAARVAAALALSAGLLDLSND